MNKSPFNLFIISLSVLYPIVVHVALYFNAASWALIYFTLLLILFVFDLCFKRNVFLALFLTALIVSVLFISLQFSSVFILYLPPITITLILFYGFAKSLLPGNTAIITLIASQVYQSNFTEKMTVYTRNCTLVWAVIMGLLALETIILALFTSIETWSLFSNILNYVFIALIFIVEYLFRIYRFGRKVTLMTYVKTLISINWRTLIMRPS